MEHFDDHEGGQGEGGGHAGDADRGQGALGGMPLEQWYFDVPIVTRTFGTVVFLTSLACKLDLISPFNLYFNYRLIIYGREYWRLLTNFLFFGTFGMEFLFYLFFQIRYSRMLEEGSFRGRTADFLWMLILGGVVMTLIAPFTDVMFLGQSLIFMMVYLWGRRNPNVHLNFLGLFNFNAPYLPWVLLLFSFVNNSFPKGDLIGICVGHLYYFMDDVYPITSHTNKHYLRAPAILQRIFHHDSNHPPIPPQDLHME